VYSATPPLMLCSSLLIVEVQTPGHGPRRRQHGTSHCHMTSLESTEQSPPQCHLPKPASATASHRNPPERRCRGMRSDEQTTKGNHCVAPHRNNPAPRLATSANQPEAGCGASCSLTAQKTKPRQNDNDTPPAVLHPCPRTLPTKPHVDVTDDVLNHVYDQCCALQSQ